MQVTESKSVVPGGASNVKIVPAVGINVLNAEQVGHGAILHPEPVDVLDGTSRIAKLKRRKSAFWFRMLKCIQCNNFQAILHGLRSNELSHANLFFHTLDEQQVLDLASALAQNNKANNGSSLQSIDIDWESLSPKSTMELNNTKHKAVLDNYNLTKRFSIGTKYNRLINKYKKEYPRASPFIAACQHGNLHDVQQFIMSHTAMIAYNGGISVKMMIDEVGKDSRNHTNKNALLVASEYCQVDIVAYLLSLDADTGVKDADGVTSLHFAALWNESMEGVPKTLNILLERLKSKDMINAVDAEGSTPLDYAYKMNKIFYSSCNKVIAVLRAHGAKANVYNEFGDRLLENGDEAS